MAKKINLSGVKEFMFNHGEKVALGTCAFLAIVFGSIGLWHAFSAGRADSGLAWAEEFKKHRLKIDAEMNAVSATELSPDKAAKMNEDFYIWKKLVSTYVQTPYNFFAVDASLKRLNPQALPIKNGPNEIQLDYVRGLAWLHEIQGNNLKILEMPAGAGVGQGMVQPGGNGGLGLGKGGLESRGASMPVLKDARPVRMVVVTAAFPMKQQLEEYQRALKMFTQKEMFDAPRDDLPRPLGINVLRFEVVNGVRAARAELLLGVDPETGKFAKSKALEELLWKAIYDEHTPVPLEPYLFEGLETPMPRLANATWPTFQAKGFEIAEDTDGEKKNPDKTQVQNPANPMKTGIGPVLPGKKPKNVQPAPDANPGMQGGVEGTVKNVKSKDLLKENPSLYKRLFERDYNIYHVLGLYPSKEATGSNPSKGFGVQQGGETKDLGRYFTAWDINPPNGGGSSGPTKQGGGLGLQPGGPNGQPKTMIPGNGATGGAGDSFANWDRDALVRFIDPDVIPGKTYQYLVQVRLANPNFNKKSEVAAGYLADVRELASTPVWTPTISIPQESFVYAIDQHLLDEWVAEKQPKKGPARADPFKLDKDQTTFQVHQWTEKSHLNNNTLTIGDWAIAERIPVRRGESIGSQAYVQVPVWYKEKDHFGVPFIKDPAVKDPRKATMKPGLLMDMKRESERPVLVDFHGGKRYRGAVVEEETAVEALILSADGSLMVLNSRADAEAIQEEDPRDKMQTSRQDRVDSARRRVNEVLRQGVAAEPANKNNGPKLPGVR